MAVSSRKAKTPPIVTILGLINPQTFGVTERVYAARLALPVANEYYHNIRRAIIALGALSTALMFAYAEKLCWLTHSRSSTNPKLQMEIGQA